MGLITKSVFMPISHSGYSLKVSDRILSKITHSLTRLLLLAIGVLFARGKAFFSMLQHGNIDGFGPRKFSLGLKYNFSILGSIGIVGDIHLYTL